MRVKARKEGFEHITTVCHTVTQVGAGNSERKTNTNLQLLAITGLKMVAGLGFEPRTFTL